MGFFNITPGHVKCKFYEPDFIVDFQYLVHEAGQSSEVAKKEDTHMIFVLSGEVVADFNEHRGLVVRENEMIFLPRSADCRIVSVTTAELIVLTYNNHLQVCSKLMLEEMQPYLTTIRYEFRPLEIRKPLRNLLDAVIGYMEYGVKCAHLYELKQQELTYIFRHYYTFNEKAMFLYHAISKNVDFKSQVMAKYMNVRTAEELARECGYGVKNFHRLFLENFGMPPYRWMQQQWAGHIRGKLLDVRIPIKAIVSEYGFSSQSHLNSYCKRYLGATPMQIRAEGNKKEGA